MNKNGLEGWESTKIAGYWVHTHIVREGKGTETDAGSKCTERDPINEMGRENNPLWRKGLA